MGLGWDDLNPMKHDWGYLIPGVNTVKLGQAAYNKFYKDPAEELKAAYDKAMARNQEQNDALKNFMMSREAKAQSYYAPLQHLFSAAYGTEGLQAPTVPTMPGTNPNPTFQGMFPPRNGGR